jgi:Flp pilus assembly CpaE family ATPase
MVGSIPFDEEVLEASMRGGTVFELADGNPAFAAVGEALSALLGAPSPR